MPKKQRDIRIVGKRKATDIGALTLAVVRLAEQLEAETPADATALGNTDKPAPPEAA